MKSTLIFFKALLLIIIFVLSNAKISGQVSLKGGNDVIEEKVLKGDPLTLRINTYRGTLQWQQSQDGTTWEDISGMTEDEIVMDTYTAIYVRVSVIEENCDPIYSAAVHIVPIELPTVLTGDISEISTTNAWCGGAVTDDGGDLVYNRGICWSTDPVPDIAGDHSMQGSGVGTFGNLITGLTPGTLYYIRAYATNSLGTVYGEQKQFTTETEIQLPVISTSDITEITHNTARGGGVVTDDGGDPATVSGLCWTTTGTPTIDDANTSLGVGEGAFTSVISGLEELTRYYVRAYASNSAGIVYGAKKNFKTDKAPVLPTVVTTLITILAPDSAVGGGEVTADGGAAVTARGVCWNTTGDPTINDSKTANGIDIGVFTSNITSLDERTSYYYRAYATNSVGTSYGEQIRFTTASSEWDGTFTDTRDGRIYGFITIGTQTWMAENLAYLPAVSIPADGSSTEKYYYVYDYEGTEVAEAKETDSYQVYGALYNYASAKNGCPPGWHLPTDMEWKTLEEYLGMEEADRDKKGWRFSGEVGGKLRSVDLWTPSNYQGLDAESFTALPGGKREVDGLFKLRKDFGYFWTNTADGTPNAWARSMWYTVGAINRYSADRSGGFSVRCVKN